MIRIITYIIVVFVLFVSNVNAQTFESKMKSLSTQMDNVIQSEKSLLKQEIKAIEKKYNNDKITFEEAEEQKKAVTKLHADNIKNKIEAIENNVHNLVQGKVENKIKSIADDKKKYFSISWDSEKNKNKRTFGYTVLAFGFNNLMKDGEINSINNSDIEFEKSRFFEIGTNYKTRIFKNSGLLYANYGLSLRYNNLRMNDNQYFVTNGGQTELVVHDIDLKKSRFKNVQIVLPVFLEFDLSKPKTEHGKKIFKRDKNWRFGFGGFGGFNFKSKQILKYKLDGKNVRDKRKGDFNVNTLVYGMQAFIGYEETSIYVKYDMQDLFTHSFEGQKNISFGVRFDL